jgi:hypothetical protein
MQHLTLTPSSSVFFTPVETFERLWCHTWMSRHPSHYSQSRLLEYLQLNVDNGGASDEEIVYTMK